MAVEAAAGTALDNGMGERATEVVAVPAGTEVMEASDGGGTVVVKVGVSGRDGVVVVAIADTVRGVGAGTGISVDGAPVCVVVGESLKGAGTGTGARDGGPLLLGLAGVGIGKLGAGTGVGGRAVSVVIKVGVGAGTGVNGIVVVVRVVWVGGGTDVVVVAVVGMKGVGVGTGAGERSPRTGWEEEEKGNSAGSEERGRWREVNPPRPSKSRRAENHTFLASTDAQRTAITVVETDRTEGREGVKVEEEVDSPMWNEAESSLPPLSREVTLDIANLWSNGVVVEGVGVRTDVSVVIVAVGEVVSVGIAEVVGSVAAMAGVTVALSTCAFTASR